MTGFAHVDSIAIDRRLGAVFEHGWQSFSPTGVYPLGTPPHRPRSERNRVLNYRAASFPSLAGYFSEGVLAVSDGHGSIAVYGATSPWCTAVRLRAMVVGETLEVYADGDARRVELPSTVTTIQQGLSAWAKIEVAAAEPRVIRTPPTTWCSWYQYHHEVTEADILENLRAIGDLDLSVEVVQIDDGYQSEIGDWLTPSPRFYDLRRVCAQIIANGRRPGIWIAPFLVGARSELALNHPEWLVRHDHGGAVHAGNNWDQDLFVLDLTHPGASAWMQQVFEVFRSWGITYFKADFLAAGSIPGIRHSGESEIAAYRSGVAGLRRAIGDEPFLLGCGAPILPSVGLVDAVRVSPDVGLNVEPIDGDMSSPSQMAAVFTGQARQFANGVLFVNDPDCLIARPAFLTRASWADHVEGVGGAVGSSDRLRDLDDWGLETTRRLLLSARKRAISNAAADVEAP